MIITIHGGEGPGEERGVDKAHALPLKRPRGDRLLALWYTVEPSSQEVVEGRQSVIGQYSKSSHPITLTDQNDTVQAVTVYT